MSALCTDGIEYSYLVTALTHHSGSRSAQLSEVYSVLLLLNQLHYVLHSYKLVC